MARPQRCHLPPKLAGVHGAIQTQVDRQPDATIAELRAWLSKTHQVSASTGLMWKTLAALDLTFKGRKARARKNAR
jgi:transposase